MLITRQAAFIRNAERGSDPIRDLAPLCPNIHAADQLRQKPDSIEKLTTIAEMADTAVNRPRHSISSLNKTIRSMSDSEKGCIEKLAA